MEEWNQNQRLPEERTTLPAGGADVMRMGLANSQPSYADTP